MSVRRALVFLLSTAAVAAGSLAAQATPDFSGTLGLRRVQAAAATAGSRLDGARLVTEGSMSQVTSQGHAAWTTMEIRSLGRDGRMVVDSRHVGTDGVITTAVMFFRKKQPGVPTRAPALF